MRRGENNFEAGDYSISMRPCRKLKDKLNFFKMFKPNNPDTVLRGGRFKQAISTFLRVKPRNWTQGTMTTGTYSVALAVMISILLVDLEGSIPMAKAISEGILVMLAPVSTTILMSLPFLDPRTRTLTTITASLVLNGIVAIMSLKSYGVTFGENIVRIVNKSNAFRTDGFFVNFIAQGAMGDQMAADRGGRADIHAVNFDQKPFMFKSAFDFFNAFRFHIWSLTSVIERVKGNVEAFPPPITGS